MRDQSYVPDAPIEAADEDRFNRAPFAKGIANTLAGLKDHSSIVIGIYAPWGEGKTSVLNLIRSGLKPFDNILVLNFNPWRFQHEDAFLVSFFRALAKAIDTDLETRLEKLAKSRWAKAFELLGQPFGVNKVVDWMAIMATVGTEEYKARVEEKLKEKGKRVVVIMDDIDRLNQAEIRTVFRLVKLTGGIDYISYVLAFDEEMVAAALDQEYSSQKAKESGRGFIEKIVQVPLHLPRAEQESLSQYCEHINMLGRYSFSVPEAVARGELRPLGKASET